ncbi:MAG TPA: ABC transporter permease [Phycisphaerae bacterium]|jgi:phospholipid/cholesterol/gamma-HCH transport system permease protein|nr:ABC transporter permease [Phycisphaerae bacterium]HPM23570.1 ABC transporter permease [Phycisphaerae bacterium]HQL54820.1 ABC transporter permease [Phycisphaerae bacterium]
MNSIAGRPRVRGRRTWIEVVGATVRGGVLALGDAAIYVGGIVRLLLAIGQRAVRALRGGADRIRLEALVQQAVRVGVRSIPIIVLVQVFIGIILALNMAPTLALYGSLERVADIVAIAVFRELGALISAVILSGFAGASIAAELGAMVEGEEIKALRAHALDPIRFLVVPRVVATTVMLVGLTALADVVGVFGGFLTAVFVLDIAPQTYIDGTRAALTMGDYFTGLFKSGVFGAIIAMLACYEGLHVTGGAEGVGRATTTTVVKSIVCLIGADCIFTAVFYVLGW